MQGQRLLLAVISGIAALSMAAPVLALEMSAPDGWYLEGNVGASRLSNTNYEGSTNKTGATYNINVGYKIMPYAAIEGGYTSYHDSKIVINGTTLANVSHYSYDIAAKGILPITCTGFEMFGKLGAAHARAKASSVDTGITGSFDSHSANATSVYIGLGGQFNVMQEVGIVSNGSAHKEAGAPALKTSFSVGLAIILVYRLLIRGHVFIEARTS